MNMLNPRTLVRARTTIRLGDTMFLRECVRTPLIARSDSPHHRIGVVLDRINERDRCDARCAEDTESQGGLGGRFRSGWVINLQHKAILAKYMRDAKLEERTRTRYIRFMNP